jgi:hypothetical protein
MMGSLKLSIIDEDGTALGSGWTNDQMRKESITTDANGYVIKPIQVSQVARRDTIQEIVESFN